MSVPAALCAALFRLGNAAAGEVVGAAVAHLTPRYSEVLRFPPLPHLVAAARTPGAARAVADMISAVVAVGVRQASGADPAATDDDAEAPPPPPDGPAGARQRGALEALQSGADPTAMPPLLVPPVAAARALLRVARLAAGDDDAAVAVGTALRELLPWLPTALIEGEAAHAVVVLAAGVAAAGGQSSADAAMIVAALAWRLGSIVNARGGQSQAAMATVAVCDSLFLRQQEIAAVVAADFPEAGSIREGAALAASAAAAGGAPWPAQRRLAAQLRATGRFGLPAAEAVMAEFRQDPRLFGGAAAVAEADRVAVSSQSADWSELPLLGRKVGAPGRTLAATSPEISGLRGAALRVLSALPLCRPIEVPPPAFGSQEYVRALLALAPAAGPSEGAVTLLIGALVLTVETAPRNSAGDEAASAVPTSPPTSLPGSPVTPGFAASGPGAPANREFGSPTAAGPLGAFDGSTPARDRGPAGEPLDPGRPQPGPQAAPAQGLGYLAFDRLTRHADAVGELVAIASALWDRPRHLLPHGTAPPPLSRGESREGSDSDLFPPSPEAEAAAQDGAPAGGGAEAAGRRPCDRPASPADTARTVLFRLVVAAIGEAPVHPLFCGHRTPSPRPRPVPRARTPAPEPPLPVGVEGWLEAAFAPAAAKRCSGEAAPALPAADEPPAAGTGAPSRFSAADMGASPAVRGLVSVALGTSGGIRAVLSGATAAPDGAVGAAEPEGPNAEAAWWGLLALLSLAPSEVGTEWLVGSARAAAAVHHCMLTVAAGTIGIRPVVVAYRNARHISATARAGGSVDGDVSGGEAGRRAALLAAADRVPLSGLQRLGGVLAHVSQSMSPIVSRLQAAAARTAPSPAELAWAQTVALMSELAVAFSTLMGVAHAEDA